MSKLQRNRDRSDIPSTPAADSRAGKGSQVQRRYADARKPADDDAQVHEAADRGVAGAGSSLPHRDAIQAAFGRHDVSAVSAQVGGDAAEACDAMGATAYATGDRVAFADQPDLHTAAHEAAHVVQQRGGVWLQGGVGRAGDRYEQNADAVADAVVAGRSAEELLDGANGDVSDSRTARPTQRKADDDVVQREEAPAEGKGQGANATPVQYTVRRGDTLAAIAKRLLGSASRWQEIADANGITDPTKLQIGQVLVIPGATAPPEPTPPPPAEDVGKDAKAPAKVGGEGAADASPSFGDRVGQAVGQVVGTIGDAITGIGTAIGDAISGVTGGKQPEAKQPEKEPAKQPEGKQPEQEPAKQPEQEPEAEDPQQTPPAQSGGELYTVTDPKAFLRKPPPDLSSTGDVIPAGSRVKILEQAQKDGKSYVRVAAAPEQGEEGAPVELGWTSKANLGGFEGGGHDKEHDASLMPNDAIGLGGLKGLDRKMATIYNAKGKYIKEQAQALGITAAAAAAVLKVESAGTGFASDGRMIIRFENHVFNDKWGKSNADVFNRHFKYNADKRWTGHQFRAAESDAWEAMHQGQSQEWKVLEFARQLGGEAALLSISMGAAQIMGFNFATEGYASVTEMFDHMSGAIKPQLVGMFTFIANTRKCIDGLRAGDYVKFAEGYNGKGQAAAYGAKIKEAADAYTRVTQGKENA